MIQIGITGTDTGVGKTVVAAAIITVLRERGLRVAPMKPVESGADARSPDAMSDAATLLQAAGGGYPMELVRPVLLAEPLAPFMAARRAGTAINTRLLDDAFHALQRDADAIVVEGAGGLLVPITERESFATLFARWSLELVIVTANRLGAINHTLLTVQAARAHGLTVRGVVLNFILSGTPDLAVSTNPGALRELLGETPLVTFPYGDRAVRGAGALLHARNDLDRLLV